MQSKVKHLSTLACASFMWLLGVSRERTDFYPTKNMRQHRLPSISITSVSGPSVANVFAKLMLERQTPPATYMVQAICQAWNQSRVNAQGRSGLLHQDISAMLNKYTWEDKNWRIYAHILDVFYPYNTSTHRLALIPLLGFGAENKKIS